MRIVTLSAVCATLCGCSASSSSSRRPAVASVPSPPPARTTAPIGVAPVVTWTALGPAPVLPPPFGDIAALAGGAAIVIANGALYRWENERATPVCEGFTPPPRSLRGDRASFIAVSDGDAIVWASSDRGTHCTRTVLPSMYVPGGQETPYGLALDDGTAVVWSFDGAVAVSHDGGRTFARVADLPGVLAVQRGVEAGLLAVRVATTAPALARNAYLPTSFAELPRVGGDAWLPRWDLPTRRAPVELRRDGVGNLWMLDGLGLARITSTGVFEAGAPEPIFRARQEQPRTIVAAGPGRFVATAEQTLLVASAEGGTHSFASIPPHDGPFAFDASPGGDVWMTTRDTLQHTRIGSATIEVAVEARTVPGNIRAMARDGAVIALAGSEMRTRDDPLAPFLTAVHHSDDSGTHWSRAALRTVDPVVAIAAARTGDVIVATGPTDGPSTSTYRLWGVDRNELIPIPIHPPARTDEALQPPVLGILGHRWVVVDGEVHLSSDQGRTWQTEPMPRMDARIVAAVVRPDGVLLLDAARHLWRSDETGRAFVSVGNADAPAGLARGVPFAPLIGWDGGDHIAIVDRSIGLLRSFDGAQTWRDTVAARSLPPVERIDVASDGQLMLWTRDVQDFGCPPEGMGLVLMASGQTDLVPLEEVCAHRAAARTLEGDRLTVVTVSGVIESADALRLPRGSVRTMRRRLFR